MPANVYECMFLLDTNKVAGDVKSASDQIHGILERNGAEVLASRPWDERKLAYPVKGQKKGLYYLTYSREDVEQLDRSELERKPHPFRTAQEAELAYENGIVQLHEYAEYRRPGHEHFLTTVGRIIFNDRVERAIASALEDEYDPESYQFVNRSLKKRDVNEMVSAWETLLGDPDYAAELGRKGREVVHREFSMPYFAERFLEITRERVDALPAAR